MPDILVTLHDREVARVPITGPETTIGRDESCDVTIDNPGISRVHAVVVLQQHGYQICDRGSQNGILINGQQVIEADLDFDVSVGLGKFRLQLVQSAHTSDLPAPKGDRASRSPRNIVQTVTIDADAARRIQERFSTGPPGQTSTPRNVSQAPSRDLTWLWWAGAAFMLAFGLVLAVRVFG